MRCYPATFGDNIGYGLGYVQQGAAAASAKTFYASVSSRIGGIVLPIKNKTGGRLEGGGVGGVTKVAWLGGFNIHDTNLTFNTPDNGGTTWDGAGNINGIAVSATATTASSNNVGPSIVSTFHGFSSGLNTAGAWVGQKGTFSAAINMTGKLFSCEYYLVLLGSMMGNEGVILAFRDSSGNWAAFRLTQILDVVLNRLYTAVIDVENATPYASGGTINWADITSITPLYHRAGSAGTARVMYMRNWSLLSASTLTGGNAEKPLNITYLDGVLNGWGYAGLCDLQGDAVVVKSKVQFGDGVKAMYYDATATLTNFPEAYDALLQREVNIPANKLEIRFKASASDTIKDVASATAAALEQDWIIDSTSNAGATYELVGKSFVNVNPTLLDGLTLSGPTFSGCAPVKTKGADLSNFSVSDTTATSSEAALVVDTSGSTLNGGTIDLTGSVAGYHIELGNGGTGSFAITLTDQTFTGTPGVDKIHVTNTAGTTTITIAGTTSLVAGDVTSDGATVVIAAPQPTLDATVLASSRVVLYNDTRDAELDNTAPGGTSWSKTISSGASVGDTLTLHVFKEGYEEFSTSFLYSGADTTLLVTQILHAAIQSLRTELSITDYTTITEFALDITGTIEIDADDADGNTQKARLAIWYNGVLTTENGARYLRGAISILSTAAIRINVDVRDLQVANISVTFGLNFTDGDRRLYRSDGSPIYAAASAPGSIQNDYTGVPDTVETGVSGLTGSESAQLLGLPSAAAVATAVWSKTLPL